MSEQYPDLGITQNQDGDYWDVVIPDLDFDTSYALQAGWTYSDKTLGISELSDRFIFTTDAEPGLPAPKFVNSDLTIYQGKLQVNWQGTDYTSTPYVLTLDYIDILYKKSTDSTFASAGVLKKAGSILIPGTPGLTYNVKLVAYSTLGKASADSQIQTIQLIGSGPNQPTGVVRAWVGETFVVSFDQNPSAPGNEFLSYHKIRLVSSANITKDDDFAVQPGTTQKYELGFSKANSLFGVSTSFSGEVWSVDIFGIESLHTTFAALSYVSALTAPTITVTQLVGGYKVSYTDQLTDLAKLVFNNISIEESITGPTSGFNRVEFGSNNPITVLTGTSIVQRWVRARVYDNKGGYSVYSNVETVTPLSADNTDTTPPAIPTVSAGTPTYNSIPLTITVTDADTKSVFVRYKKSTESLYAYDTLPVTVGSNSWTIKGLYPSTQYNIAVSGGDSFSNYSAYGTDINSTTAASTPSAATSVIVSALSTGVGVLSSWTAPSSSPTLITKYKVELYRDPSVSNVLEQTQYSFSNNISFGGLLASTAYRVLVYAQDEFGVFATAALSSIFTTNTAGGLSDGVAPASSPTPVVTSLYGALEVRWTPITNADIVTYEVHASTTTGFTPSGSTKILEVAGTFAIIKTISATPLVYGTTYYVKLIAKDVDGSAAAGAQGSAITLQVDNGDLAANAVRANVILAGTITATQMDADNLFIGKTFKVGTGGIIYSGTTGVYANANTGFYLDSTGQFSLKDRLTFSGTTLTVNGVINADSGDLKGALTVNSGTMKIGKAVESTNDGIYIDANNYWYSNGNFRTGGTGTGITSTGGSLSIVSPVTITGTSSITGNLGVTGTIYSGGSATNGARTLINTGGLFAYDATSASATTSINATASTGGITFSTSAATIGNWTVATNTIKAVNNLGGVTLDSSNIRVVVSPSSGSYTTAMSSGNSTYSFWAGAAASNGLSTDQQVIDAPFNVTHFGVLTANDAIIKGEIKATSGFFGTAGSTRWEINATGITASANAVINLSSGGSIVVGDYKILSSGTNFVISQISNGLNLIKTESVSGATEDPLRIFIGDSTRQTEVAKSAQISGNGTTLQFGADTATNNAYRSGGLRNMYTVSLGNASSAIYPSALKGDILLIYDTTAGL